MLATSKPWQPSPLSLGKSFLLQLASGLDAANDESTNVAAKAPGAWDKWLRELFPHLFSAPFADHHREFWEWVESITADTWQPAFLSVWSRGGAKTTSAEAAVVRLGARRARRFCLYVRSVQDRANESVRNIAAMLESAQVEKYYPLLASRRMSKYGFSQGWKADMLRCASGFSVVGLGFDAAVRGVKIEGDRPDLILFDDLDEKTDTLATIEKKIRILTSSILPAGSSNAVILGIQNLVHTNGIFSRLVDGTADFLYDRKISGPHPAIVGLTYEERAEGGYHITGGEATWEGQNLATCERQINEWGLTAFLQEAQHEIDIAGGIWNDVTFRHANPDEVPAIVRGVVWIDPAVTSTDESDCQAMQADGLGVDGKLYRFYSWEGITSPEDIVTKAVLKCLELGFESVGIETDQGGDTWKSVYAQVWQRIVEAAQWHVRLSSGEDSEAEAWAEAHPELAPVAPLANDIVGQRLRQPSFKSAKAGQGHGSKVARNQRMLVSYEQGKVIHVSGTHLALERSLRRFPNKPLDLADAAYWGWWDLVDSKAHAGKVGQLAARREAQAAATPAPPPPYSALRYKGDKQFPLTIGHTTYMIEAGWQRQIDRDTAAQIVQQFPQYFEVVS